MSGERTAVLFLGPDEGHNTEARRLLEAAGYEFQEESSELFRTFVWASGKFFFHPDGIQHLVEPS